MVCPNCNEPMIKGKKYFVCEECGYKVEIPTGLDISEYRRFFLSQPMPSLIVNVNSSAIVECNDTFAGLFGFSSAEDLQNDSVDPYDYFQRDKLDQLFERVRSSERTAVFDQEVVTNWGVSHTYSAYVASNPSKTLAQMLLAPVRNIRNFNLNYGENYFKAVADYTYDWEIWINSAGGLNWVNPSSERITGYAVEECFDIPGYPLPLIHESDRDVIAKHLSNANNGGFGNDVEFRYVTKDRRTGWAALSYQPITDASARNLGYRLSIRDINERKILEQALRASEANYKNMADFLPSVVAEFDTALNLVYINKKGMETFQYDAKDLARPVNLAGDMVDKADKLRMEQDIRSAVHNVKMPARIYRFAVKDGTTTNAIFNVSLIDDGEELKGFRVSLVPIKSILYSIVIPDDYFYAEYKLTEREKEIVNYLIIGLKIKQIGGKCGISESTVKTHIASVYAKLKINTKDELFEFITRYQTNRFGYETLIFSLIKSIIDA